MMPREQAFFVALISLTPSWKSQAHACVGHFVLQFIQLCYE